MSEREPMTAENVGAIADNYEAMAWDFVRQTDPDNQLGVTEKHEVALLRAWADELEGSTQPTRAEVAKLIADVILPADPPSRTGKAIADVLIARGWLGVSDTPNEGHANE